MAEELENILPMLAELSKRGLKGQHEHPKLIFDKKDLLASNISSGQREYQNHHLLFLILS